MLSRICCCGALLCCLSAAGQKVIDITRQDGYSLPDAQISAMAGGQIISAVRYVKVKEGSPFFHDEWIKGKVLTPDGKIYRNLDLRINLLEDEVDFRDATGQEKIATVPIQAVILGDSSSGVSYVFVRGSQWSETDRSLARSWVQVLVNDKVSLLRQIKKNKKVSTPYGSSTDEETIDDVQVFYLQMGGQLIKVKDFDALQGLLRDKKDQVGQYIRSHHLRGHLPEEYAEVVTYYNSIVAS